MAENTATLPLSALPGTLLAAHYHWLIGHAAPGPAGDLRCKFTQEMLHSRVVHRYRMNADGPDAPFVPDVRLPNTSGLGRMISFVAYTGCRRCNERLPIPESVFRSDIIEPLGIEPEPQAA